MKSIIKIFKLSLITTLIMTFGILIKLSFTQGLANVYQLRSQSDTKDIDSKINLIIKALIQEPDNAELHELLGKLYFDKSSQTTVDKSKFLKNAIISFQNAIQLNPTNYKYHLFLANSTFKLDNDSEKFIRKLNMINKLDPHNEIISNYRNQFDL